MRTPDQLLQQAILAYQQGRLPDAIAGCRRVIELTPSQPGAYHLLGDALAASGDREGALQAYYQLIRLIPRMSPLLYSIAQLEHELGRSPNALQPLRTALQIEPNNAAIHNLLARVYTAINQHVQALSHHKRAADLLPGSDSALNNFGVALHRAGNIGEAEKQLRRAVEINPASSSALTNLGTVLREQGRVANARECYLRAMALNPESSAINSIYLYLLHFDPAFDEQAIQTEHRKWAEKHLAGLPLISSEERVDQVRQRRLRIGYVSADFRQHVVGRFLEPILKLHDRNQFEIFCYSDTTAVDSLTNRLRASVDQWRDTAGLNDEQLANLIARDQIDILLDTTGHMEGNRLCMFARKPAPAQISHIGYPASSGVPQIGFRVTDRHLDPAPIAGSNETLLYLPDSFYLYQNEMQQIRPADKPPMIANGFVTFGSLNGFAKTSEASVALWSAVLQKVADSKLLLAVPLDGAVNESVVNRFATHGIHADRLMLEPTRPFEEYLKLYNRIDIALDPQPYGGGITNCDALWMGVAIVTLLGKTSVGRIGATLLRNAGLDDLVAEDAERYANIAAELAGDPDRIRKYRVSLRDQLRQSPLMDAARYACELERLYLQAVTAEIDCPPADPAIQ